MLYMATVYQDPQASNRILGKTADGDTFTYDWPKKKFTWTSCPEGPIDFTESSLKSSLRQLAKDLISGSESISTVHPSYVRYRVHP